MLTDYDLRQYKSRNQNLINNTAYVVKLELWDSQSYSYIPPIFTKFHNLGEICVNVTDIGLM